MSVSTVKAHNLASNVSLPFVIVIQLCRLRVQYVADVTYIGKSRWQWTPERLTFHPADRRFLPQDITLHIFVQVKLWF